MLLGPQMMHKGPFIMQNDKSINTICMLYAYVLLYYFPFIAFVTFYLYFMHCTLTF